jgi:hypothetical protein
MTWRKHPGKWFSLWSIETAFLLALAFALLDLDRTQYYLSQLFLRVWIYFCFWWITLYHVRWLEKIDAKQYKKQKEKDEWEKQKWVL